MPVKMSRKCIPYTPFRKELREVTLAIVSVAGVYLKSQDPFNLEDDVSYRIIPGDANAAEMAIAHEHYDHSDADRDPNIMFPLERARELQQRASLVASMTSISAWAMPRTCG